MVRLLALSLAVAVAIPAEHDAPKRVVSGMSDDKISQVVSQMLHERDVAAEEAKKAQELKDAELDRIASKIVNKMAVSCDNKADNCAVHISSNSIQLGAKSTSQWTAHSAPK